MAYNLGLNRTSLQLNNGQSGWLIIQSAFIEIRLPDVKKDKSPDGKKLKRCAGKTPLIWGSQTHSRQGHHGKQSSQEGETQQEHPCRECFPEVHLANAC